MRRYRISLTAQHDLRDIRIYSKAAFGVAAAKEYLLGIREKFVLLRDRPFAGAAQTDVTDGLRAFTYRSHRIYYLVGVDEVLIVRILHNARNHSQVIGR